MRLELSGATLEMQLVLSNVSDTENSVVRAPKSDHDDRPQANVKNQSKILAKI
jgi:hypothetical protein